MQLNPITPELLIKKIAHRFTLNFLVEYNKAIVLVRMRASVPIIQWLEENLILPDNFPFPGRFNINRSPHLREPLEKAIDPTVRSIALMGCSQMAKTLYFICVWAYKTVNDPAPGLYANPTDAGVKSFAIQKLEPVINSSPILKQKIVAKRRGNTDESNTRFKINADGSGWLEIISLQSPGKTRQRSVRDIYDDDGDELKINLKSEGNPHSNLETRTTVFKYNYKHFYGSTPREEETSFINMKYKEGSQGKLQVICTHCGVEQVLDEDLIEWEKEKIDLLATEFHNNFSSSKIKCRNCGYLFNENERMDMLLNAKWVHKHQNRKEHLSYQMGKASSTLGSLEKIAEAKYTAEKAAELGDDSLLESFVNNEKGLPYRKVSPVEIDAKVLIDRREDYMDPEKRHIIPNGIYFLTGFVDAQAGGQARPARFEGEVWGWGYGEECWIVDKFIIEGSPEDRNTRERLKSFILSLEYEGKDGRMRQIRRWGFDSGWASQSIYEIVERMTHKGWYATKGANNYGAPLLPRKVSLVNHEKSQLITIGTQAAQAILYERLANVNLPGPKYIHHTKLFCDLNYYDQITSHHAEPVQKGLTTILIYKKKKPGLADEAVDIWYGNYAMMKSLNVNWKKYKVNFDAKVGALSNQETVADASIPGGKERANSASDNGSVKHPVNGKKLIVKKNKAKTHGAGRNPVMNY